MSVGRRIATNAGYLGILTASNYLLGLLIFPYLSRVLSLDTFGLVGFSMSFVVIFQMLVEYGFMIVATARVAKARENPLEVGRIIATTMAAKSVLAVIAVATFGMTVLLVPMVQDHVAVVALFMLSAVVTALIPDFYFRGIEKMRPIALRAVGSKAVALLLILSLVRGDEELLLVPLALLVGNMTAVILAFIAVYRAGIRLPRPSIADTVRSLRDGLGFFASRAAASVNQAAGAVALGLQFAPASPQMAQFTGASRIASAGELAVIPVSDSIYPHMVRSRDFRVFWRVYLGGLAAWFLGCLSVFVLSEQLCVLVLGPSFAPAGALLRILSVGVFIAYSSNLFGYPALTPIGRAQHANYALLCGAIVTVSGLVVLVATGTVSPTSVCILLVISQGTILAYRLGAFLMPLGSRPAPGG